MTSDTIIKKITEAHLVTSDQFYEAYARSLREGPQRWRIFFNDNDDEAGDDKIDRFKAVSVHTMLSCLIFTVQEARQ